MYGGLTNNDNLVTNGNGTRLLNLSEEYKFFDEYRHTSYSPTGFTKRVDYILAEWHIKFQLSCVS